MKPNLLIVEDDNLLAKQLKLFFHTKGEYNVITSGSKEETLEILEGFTPDVVILDLGLPPLENSPQIGLSLLPHLVKASDKVIVLTGQTSKEAAIEAIRLGAFDYIQKPASAEILELSVKRALFIRDIEAEIEKKEGKKIEISRSIKPLEEKKSESPLSDYDFSQGLDELKTKFEKDIVEKALKLTGFNIVRTAKLLKISRESVYYLLKKHNIKRESL